MLKRIKAFTLYLFAFIGFSALSFAETVADQDVHPSLPQLDIATYPSQLFWLVVSFFLFYSLCALFIVPRLRTLIKTRRNHVTAMMEEANELAMQADKYQLRAEETFKQAKETAHQLLATKKAKLKKDFDAALAELTHTSQHQTQTQIQNLKSNVQTAAPEMVEKISAELTAAMMHKICDTVVEPQVIKKTIKKELMGKELVA